MEDRIMDGVVGYIFAMVVRLTFQLCREKRHAFIAAIGGGATDRMK